MLLSFIFLFLGIYTISKKEIKISSKRSLSGGGAKRVGFLFLFTGIFGLLPLVVSELMAAVFSLLHFIGIVISILVALYLILFKKN